jgi:hypoxanthine phosphoribosyltransferase
MNNVSLSPIIVPSAGLAHRRDRADLEWLKQNGRDRYTLLISSTHIKRRIAELASEIALQFRKNRQKEINFLVVMNGAVFFARRLARETARHGGLKVLSHYVQAASYGNAEHSSGLCRLDGNLRGLRGKDVIIVEDICDSGLTMKTIRSRLLKKECAVSVQACVLLDKPARRLKRLKGKLALDFIGFKIPPVFVAGCGMHYGRYYRNLPFVICRKNQG